MKVLLTGADGFTGRHFAERALKAGHAVVPLKTDLRDLTGLKTEVAHLDFDAVVHLAALSSVVHANELELYEINTLGTVRLLEALAPRATMLRCVLMASSANIYGNCIESPISETQCPAPLNHYAASKLAMEHMVRARLDDLPLVITRPFNYTGVGQSSQFVIPKLIEHVAQKRTTVRLGNVHVAREFNDVRMVCDAYISLLSNAKIGHTYNICTGVSHPLSSVIQLLGEISGHELSCQVDPTLVRQHEVLDLCGDPRKWRSVCPDVHLPSLKDTLIWMLSAQGVACK